jgi:hypothetical protein
LSNKSKNKKRSQRFKSCHSRRRNKKSPDMIFQNKNHNPLRKKTTDLSKKCQDQQANKINIKNIQNEKGKEVAQWK